MNQKKFLIVAGAAVVLLGAGIWLSMQRSSQQADRGGGNVFADLKAALGDIEEIRLSKGDGSRTTLHRDPNGWTVVERHYPADAARVRELALGLAGLRIVERKTSDPANYAKLGVEAPDKPTAGSTLVEVVAGPKTWSLIVGKAADARAVYVRKPAEAASALAQPVITADPDQKRWIDRVITDIPGASVYDVAVKPATGPAYVLTRADRKATDVTLSPIPKGRTPVSPMSLNGQADALTGFHFDDVRALPAATAPAAASTPTDSATYRTFDGQVIEFTGHREGDKAFVAISTRRDPELAAKFPEPAPAPAASPPAATPVPAAPATPAKLPDQTAETLGARAKGVEYEIPAYKYEAIFKKQEELLEKPAPAPAKAAKPAKAATK
jgi:hypothetical protein